MRATLVRTAGPGREAVLRIEGLEYCVRDGFSWSAAHAPAIGAPEIGRRPGEIRTFRFRCLRSFKRGGFHILEADGAEFDAAIPFEVFKSLPGSLDFSRRTIEATGLVELYKGRPQVMIGVPIQIKRVD